MEDLRNAEDNFINQRRKRSNAFHCTDEGDAYIKVGLKESNPY